MAGDLVTNGRFAEGKIGGVPTGWSVRSPRASLQPLFRLATRDGKRVLRASGNGRDDCVGHLVTPLTLHGGQTYRLRARLSATRGLDIHRSLLIGVFGKDFNNGITAFTVSRNGTLQGEARFCVPRTDPLDVELRVTFRATAKGSAWLDHVSLEACEPIPPRPVRISTTQGQGTLEEWGAALDVIGTQGADIALLPETIRGTTWEDMRGPSAQLMGRKAKQYHMHVAGGIYYYEARTDQLLNRALLFGRDGKLAGWYDKIHPYSPEVHNDGVTAGTLAPVFTTDVGVLGIIICYDSWFTDVSELLALRGAQVLLFPNAGYYRSLMPARAADNGVRVVAASLYQPAGIWDTAGREVLSPDADPTCFAGDEQTFSDVRQATAGGIGILSATLDLSRSPSPHNWGGPLLSAPGGRRNRRDQRVLLNREIEDAQRRP